MTTAPPPVPVEGAKFAIGERVFKWTGSYNTAAGFQMICSDRELRR